MLRTCTSCNEHVGTSTASARRPQDNVERGSTAASESARDDDVVHVGYADPPPRVHVSSYSHEITGDRVAWEML